MVYKSGNYYDRLIIDMLIAKKNSGLVFLRHSVHVQFHNTCAIGMVILSTPKSHDLRCAQTSKQFFPKMSISNNRNLRVIFRTRDNESLENLQI